MKKNIHHIKHMNTSDIPNPQESVKKDWKKPSLVDISISQTLNGNVVSTTENAVYRES